MGSDTRAAILASARDLFAEVGYERASIRGIARRAGVDAALVHHYFGTKDELLAAAVDVPVDIGAVAEAAFEDRARAGEVLIRSVLAIWEVPEFRSRFLGLVRAAVTHPGAASMLREAIVRGPLRDVTRRIDLPAAQLRAELAATHIIGLMMGRHVLQIEPLASATPDELARAIGPALQRYLTEPDLVV